MRNNRKFLLQIARGKRPKDLQHFYSVYVVVNGERTLRERKEINFDHDINIEVITSSADLLKMQGSDVKREYHV